MNVGQLLRESWRITWRNWPLWLLNLLLLIAFVPAGALAGALGGAPALLSLPWPGPEPAWLTPLRAAPAWAWAIIALGALVLLVLTSALAWALQVAAMRGAALAAEHGTFRLGQAVRLGRQRVVSILKLSATFGTLIAALTVLPPVALVLAADRFEFARPLLRAAQTGLAPVNTALGLALLIVMMSVALEEAAPRRALRRAWTVFRSGWWGFVLVLAISFLPAVVLALLALPLAFVLPVAFFNPRLGTPLVVACCGVLGPIGLVVLLFTAVFTIVLYTLIYRSAAQQVDSAARSA